APPDRRDPLQTIALNRRMDHVLKGHPYAKSAIDMACWDLVGKNAEQPLAEMLGGRYGETVALYRSVPQAEPDRMAAQARKYVEAGYKRIQVKVGLDPDEDVARIEAVRDALPRDVVLFADANSGWNTHQARRFLRATRALDYYLEQPCDRYEENLALRADCDRPLILDESIDGLAVLMRACADRLADGITIKLARVGGITKARLIRDTAVEMGLAVTVEDTGGAEIDTAAMAHMSLSTPDSARLHTVDFHNWVTVSNATGMPPCKDGQDGGADRAWPGGRAAGRRIREADLRRRLGAELGHVCEVPRLDPDAAALGAGAGLQRSPGGKPEPRLLGEHLAAFLEAAGQDQELRALRQG
ncbi:MAG: hypothetical protein HC861_11215, partial [Rhodospirillaceae bacterium]|nr:hypothetical protein [Rhodospirillaceae bacterium]